MRTVWAIALTAFCLAPTVQAQQTPRAGRPERPAGRPNRETAEALGQMSLADVAGRLANRLELTDQQRTQYDGIVDKYTNAWAEAQNAAAQRRDLARQAREARQSGDEKHADELRAQMDKLGAGPAQLLGQFADAVEPILNPQQVAKLDEFRQQAQQRLGQAARAAGMMELVQRLPAELKLDADQKAEFDALVAEQRQRIEEVQPLMRELRQARQSGDQARVADLEKQIAEKRGAGDGERVFYQKLEGILSAEQKAKLAELRAKAAGTQAAAANVRTLFQTARKLDLSPEQKNRLREIMRGVTGSVPEGAANADARADLAQRVKQQIVEMLDAKQAAEFEKLLQAEQRPSGGNRPGAGRTRGAGNRSGQPDKTGAEQPANKSGSPQKP